jgi:hypothetical protein
MDELEAATPNCPQCLRPLEADGGQARAWWVRDWCAITLVDA